MNKNKDYSEDNKTVNVERIDEIDRFYAPIRILDKLNGYLFWLSILLSFVVLYRDVIPHEFRELPEMVFALLVILQLLSELYIRYELFPIAERKRIQQLLSNSLGVSLTIEQTQKYYNNEVQPSFTRLAANTLENTHFAKTISGRMANQALLIVLFYFIVWFTAMISRSTNLGFLIIITQTLFSSEILGKWLALEFLRKRNENYYNELYRIFFHKTNLESPSAQAALLDVFASYEVAKGISGIRMSEAIFRSENPKLSKEWDEIRKKLNIGLE